jgi:hypothetical protein
MTAEIFRRHGVFFGKTRKMGDGGVGYNENLTLKEIGRRLRKDCHDAILRRQDAVFAPDAFGDTWKAILESEGFKGGYWGAKVDAFCHRLFNDLPNHRVAIWRNEDDTVASCMRAFRNKRSEDEWRRIVRAHHSHLKNLNLPTINTDAIMAGDHSSIEKAFEVCGLTYDRSIAETVIVR